MQTRPTSGRPVLLGLLAYWAGLLVAARNYPGGYDWPYTTISSLVYADRNPSGFLWARSGMVLCGMFGLYWTVRLSQSSKRWPAPQAAGIWTLRCGYLCMACCALLPEHSLGTPRAHDALALAAFLSLCVGTVPGSFTALYRSTRHRRLTGPPWLCAGILAGLALAPVLLAALAQAYVSHALPALPWVSPVWRARGVPVCLSFAFWEWVTCASLSLYLVLLSRTAAAERRRAGMPVRASAVRTGAQGREKGARAEDAMARGAGRRLPKWWQSRGPGRAGSRKIRSSSPRV